FASWAAGPLPLSFFSSSPPPRPAPPAPPPLPFPPPPPPPPPPPRPPAPRPPPRPPPHPPPPPPPHPPPSPPPPPPDPPPPPPPHSPTARFPALTRLLFPPAPVSLLAPRSSSTRARPFSPSTDDVAAGRSSSLSSLLSGSFPEPHRPSSFPCSAPEGSRRPHP